MSYNIKTTNGTSIIALPDGTLNTLLDITLVGKNYAGYGLPQNENFLYLLENFSNTSPPKKAISGELWFDSTTTNLKINVNDGTDWKTLAVINVGSAPDVVDTGNFVRSTQYTKGDLWFDSVNDQLNVFDGTKFLLIGPESLKGYGTTRMISKLEQGTPIQLALVDGTALFSLSKLSIPSSTVPGVPVIHQGITINGSYKIYGNITNSDNLGNFPPEYFAPINNPVFTSSITTTNDGINVGTAFNISNQSNIPTISAKTGTTLNFTTKDGVNTALPLTLFKNAAIPGSATSTLGTVTSPWYNVYANLFTGVATKSLTLQVDGTYQSANIDGTVPSSIVARDSNGYIITSKFIGDLRGRADIATRADSATLADAATLAYNVNWSNVSGIPSNFVINDNNITQYKINISGNVLGNTTGTHTGPVIGNVTGNTTGQHTGSVQGNVTGNVTGNLYGNASTATSLQTPRNINGISFNGTTDITITSYDVPEANNLYFTTARARASVSAQGSLNYNLNTGVFSYTQGNTDTVPEGSSNLYFTTGRARSSISATGGLTYNPATGVMYGPPLAGVALSGDYNALINKPSIPAPVNIGSINDSLQNIVRTIVGTIDLYMTSSGGSGYSSGYVGASVGGGWSSSTTYNRTGVTAYLGNTGGSISLTVDVAAFIGCSANSGDRNWKGNFEFNLAPSITRILDQRIQYYGMGANQWSVACSPVTFDRNSPVYGQFVITMTLSGDHYYHGTNLQAGWIGIGSRTNNVYNP